VATANEIDTQLGTECG